MKKTENMKLLFVDAGNSLIKYAIQTGSQLIYFKVSRLEEFFSCIDQKEDNFDYILYSSVLREKTNEYLKSFFSKKSSNVISINQVLRRNIKSKYNIDCLGDDRAAAVIYGCSLKNDNMKILIDAGTAITIDYVDKHNCFLGGYICSGVDLELKSLNINTQMLPLVDSYSSINTSIPIETKGALQKGVLLIKAFGIQKLIEDDINRLNISCDQTKIYITGGGGKRLQKLIKNSLYIDNMVLKGLSAAYKQLL